jgi:hypothetical protein
MLTLEELHAHYKAVRARLSTPPTPKMIAKLPEFEPEPVIEVVPEPEPCVILAFPGQPMQTPGNVIIQSIAMKHGVTVKDIKSQSRKHEHVVARQEAAYELRKQRNFSLTKIGQMLGNRDHTTILHALRKHEERLAKQKLDEPSE